MGSISARWPANSIFNISKSGGSEGLGFVVTANTAK
jgi:hypothetical protein